MRSTLKFLLLLGAFQLGVSALVHRRIGTLESEKSCGEGQYYSKEAGFCYECKTCDESYYEAVECTETSNTVCKWCGDQVPDGEWTEELMGRYADRCSVDRKKLFGKVQFDPKNIEIITPSDYEEEYTEGKGTDENAIDVKQEERSATGLKRKFVRDLEKHFENEENERLSREYCDEGQYYNGKEKSCFNCSTCGKFLYETAKCTKISNTVCTWCGKDPDFEAISDVVLTSYQNKCLMGRLDFVGMHGLFQSNSNSEEETYDSEEESEDEGDDQKERSLDAHVRVALEKREEDVIFRRINSKTGVVITEEPEDQSYEDDEDEDDSQTEDDDELDKSVSNTVNAYFIKKGKKIIPKVEALPDESIEESVEESAEEDSPEEETAAKIPVIRAYLTLPMDGDFELNDEEENKKQDEKEFEFVASSWEHRRLSLPADLPKYKSIKDDDDSTEESNERVISWDKWVDDEVKPIKKADVVEAEPINPWADVVVVVDRSGEEDEGEEVMQKKISSFSTTVLIFCSLMTFVTLSYAFYACIRIRSQKSVFLGVPTDSPDYHMILHASRHIEELEAKEKKASRHIHENPIFDA